MKLGKREEWAFATLWTLSDYKLTCTVWNISQHCVYFVKIQKRTSIKIPLRDMSDVPANSVWKGYPTDHVGTAALHNARDLDTHDAER